MFQLLSLKKKLTNVLDNTLNRVKHTLKLYNEIFLFLTAVKRSSKAQLQSPTYYVVIASDFLPTIHGGIYRPLSWLQLAAIHDVCVELLTNTPKRINTVGKLMTSESLISNKIHYCDESEFQLFSRPSRVIISRPEFLLAALQRLEQMHKAKQISHIIATGPDFSSFVIAAMFAQKHDVRLHLDYRDEWTQSPFEFSQPTFLAKILEKACVSHADSISMTTQSQMNNFKRHFRGNTPLFLRQNGCDNFPERAPGQLSSIEELRLCHSGSIGGHNSLEQVLFLFNELSPKIHASGRTLHLTFCGSIAENQLSLISMASNFKITTFGQLTPEQAFTHSSEADLCLLLIDHRYERYLPGKLFGYIATGNPILIIGAESSTEISSLCNEFEIPHFFADCKTVDTNACADFILNARSNKTAPAQLIRFRESMDRQQLAKEFFEIFNNDTTNV